MAVKASATITLSAVTDIESVWWYYKLQSSTLNPPAKPTTNPPPSGWTDAEPAYTPGSTNTLYFVELTVFSDGTFDYGNVSVSSSYEAAKAAWNKAQAVDERVSVAETAIEQTQQAIQLRATKTEVQTVATAASNAQSAADAAQSAATGAQGTANAAQSAASAAQTAADNAASAAQTAQGAADAAQSAADAAQSAADSAQEGADFATPLTGAEPPEEAPAAGKLWIDEGQTPSVWRRWRGADVPTDREYEETVSGNADSPSFVAIDNAQGQLQTVALEVGCVAQQAGTGDPSPTNIRAISGRESVEVQACGKNMATTQPVIVSTQEQIVIDFGRDVHFDAIVASFMAKNLTMQGAQAASIDLRLADGTHQYRTWWDFLINGQSIQPSGNPDGLAICTLNNVTFRQLVVYWMTDTYARIGEGSELSDFQLELGSSPLAYEPYTPMGGGTVTPTEPLYGLPGAEVTVEVSVDGDVTVTRRTAVVELDGTEDWWVYTDTTDDNTLVVVVAIVGAALGYQTSLCSHFENDDAAWNKKTFWTYSDHPTVKNKYFVVPKSQIADIAAWKSWLAAQKAAGTPVTIVYELAAPETEALTAISPIAPEAGPVNVWTDADTLTATVSGSGWETVNDTNDIRTALADVDSNVAGLIASMGLLEGTVAQIGEQMITPEGIVSIVAESDGYQALVNMANQSAEDFELVQTTITNINGRVETLEEGVHVEGSNVGLYSSGSPFRMDIDHTGIGITENGQPTITVRESRADIPRIMTETLIIGGFAYRAGENDLYQMIV